MMGCGKDANSYRASGFSTRPQYDLGTPTFRRVLPPLSTGMDIRCGFSLAQGGIFVLKGIHGQFIFVDPGSKLIMVHTAVRQKPNDPANAETRALWDAVVQQLGK